MLIDALTGGTLNQAVCVLRCESPSNMSPATPCRLNMLRHVLPTHVVFNTLAISNQLNI